MSNAVTCTWASTRPGMSVRPARSIVAAPAGTAPSPLVLIPPTRPSSTTRETSSSGGPPEPSIIRAEVRWRGWVMGWFPARRPARGREPRPYALPRPGAAAEGLLDAVEAGEMGDHVGDREASVGHQPGQLLELGGGVARAVVAALECLLREQVEARQRHLDAARRGADHHGGGARPQHVPGQPDRLGPADRLEGVVDAAVGERRTRRPTASSPASRRVWVAPRPARQLELRRRRGRRRRSDPRPPCRPRRPPAARCRRSRSRTRSRRLHPGGVADGARSR